MNELKEKNKQALSRLTKKFYYIVFSMWFIGAFLIIINPDQLMTVGVFVIFFGFILLIITIFLSALNASKKMKTQIKNSVDLVYQNYLSYFNHKHGTDYNFNSEIESNQDAWYLVPSFATKSIYYVLEDEQRDATMYYAQAYNVAGANQTRSYYFIGLYFVFDHIEGFSSDMQYRDKGPFYQKVITKLTPLIGEDQHRTSRFEYKNEMEEGFFYSHEEKEMPELFQELRKLLNEKEYITSIKLAIQDHQLHIALEQKDKRLPYIKKYQEEELNQIEKIVEENASLLHELEEVLEPYIKKDISD